MSLRLLLATDLDRTLLPNGIQPESPRARERFCALAALGGVTIAYVSGRHRRLVEAAIAEYALPTPRFVVADVGTSVYRIDDDGCWRDRPEWQEDIARDWGDASHADLARRLADLPALRLQEPARQGRLKLSYEVSLDTDRATLLAAVGERLAAGGVRTGVVWSVDETIGIGLLDVLPARATKLHAVEFLMRETGSGLSSTVFAGDSGNDIEALASAVPAVLVANATDEVRAQALDQARRHGHHEALYLARGGFLGMNGNYAAGILEGVAHFHPAIDQWLCAAESRSVAS